MALTVSTIVTGLATVDCLVSYGFRYEMRDRADRTQERVRVAYAKFKVSGEDHPREITKTVTDAQFNLLSVTQLESLVLNAIKQELGL